MKKQFFSILGFIALLVVIMVVMIKIWDKNPSAKEPDLATDIRKKAPEIDYMNNMVITSPAFENNGKLPSRFTCDGGEISPPLEISGVPEGTKSLALIANDKDDEQKKDEGGRAHWVKWNIPPDTTVIEEGKNPPSIEEKGQKEGLFYQGACPPFGEHHYSFKVFALDKELDILGGATKNEVEIAMLGHIIGDGEIVGVYSRN